MLHQSAIFFGDAQKMLAEAMHAAGATDREIADANHTSVNNIIHWRKEAELRENVPAGAVEQSAPARQPVERDPLRARPAAVSAAITPPSADPRLVTPSQAKAAFVAPVQPTGDNALEIGLHMDAKAYVDLAELLNTRLLIQGNSGSGKTHLLRRILEESANTVQQIIIDPEGDFVSFGDAFGHLIVDANTLTVARLAKIAGNARQHRGSVVLTLEGMSIEPQMEAVTAFLNALFEAGPDHWHPAIVAVDEAHLFAPTGDNGEDRETRKQSQLAMANLMCRGRKRGLAGIIATQRLSKLSKNVAAEASNYLMGRTFLDIDVTRVAESLGIRSADAEQVRNLVRGEFLGLGPAIARRMLKVKIGPVQTKGKARIEEGITPLPMLKPEDMHAALLADDGEDEEQQDHVVVPIRAARGK